MAVRIQVVGEEAAARNQPAVHKQSPGKNHRMDPVGFAPRNTARSRRVFPVSIVFARPDSRKIVPGLQNLEMVRPLGRRALRPDRSQRRWYWKSVPRSPTPDPAKDSDLVCWPGSDCSYIRRLRMLMQGRAKSKVQVGGNLPSFHL